MSKIKTKSKSKPVSRVLRCRERRRRGVVVLPVEVDPAALSATLREIYPAEQISDLPAATARLLETINKELDR